jgi:hypothetical protein
LYTKGNENHFHHTILYECDIGLETEYLSNSSNKLPPQGPCVDQYYGEFENITASNKRFNPIRDYCYKIMLGWAIGGDYVIIT